jgi:hypothetical protein
MNHSRNIASMEAKFLMDALVELAERRNSYPQHVNAEYATDDNIKKMGILRAWL